MADLSSPFGAALRTARRSRGWNLRELARRSGISFGRLAELERGRDAHTDRIVLPSYYAVVRLACALEMDPVPWLVLAGHPPGLELTDAEWKLLGLIRRLPDEERQVILRRWQIELEAWFERRIPAPTPSRGWTTEPS